MTEAASEAAMASRRSNTISSRRLSAHLADAAAPAPALLSEDQIQEIIDAVKAMRKTGKQDSAVVHGWKISWNLRNPGRRGLAATCARSTRATARRSTRCPSSSGCGRSSRGARAQAGGRRRRRRRRWRGDGDGDGDRGGGDGGGGEARRRGRRRRRRRRRRGRWGRASAGRRRTGYTPIAGNRLQGSGRHYRGRRLPVCSTPRVKLA